MQVFENNGTVRQEADKSDNPAIVVDVTASFTYASYQNAIPVIRSILVENNTDRHIESCRLDLTSSPSFLRPKSWIVDRLMPGDRLPLADRKVEFDASYLSGLNEAERGEITLRLCSGGKILDERRLPVRLLARDEWGGVADMAQLLPAFVMPNDPGVAQILRQQQKGLLRTVIQADWTATNRRIPSEPTCSPQPSIRLLPGWGCTTLNRRQVLRVAARRSGVQA